MPAKKTEQAPSTARAAAVKATAATKTAAVKTKAASTKAKAAAKPRRGKAAATTAASGNGSAAGRRNGRQHDLVIVESPAKARTIAGILGAGYEVTASVGHVRDLPRSRLGVDVD